MEYAHTMWVDVVFRHMQALCALLSLLFSSASQLAPFKLPRSYPRCVRVADYGLFFASVARMCTIANVYSDAFFHCLISKRKKIYLVNLELTILSK
jgi:hypothetical protein